MKKSRKILLYGFLSSILLIILCLYLHQGELMNAFDNDALSLEEKNISIEQVLTAYKTVKDSVNEDQHKKEQVLVDRTRSSKPLILEKNTTVTLAVKPIAEVNVSKEPEEMVDENLPPLDNFPILDDGSLKEEKSSTSIETNSSTVKSLNLTQETISNIIKRERIYFYKNRAKLSRKGKRTLDKVVKILKGIPDINITIKGYTDAGGRRKINQWISLERAKSVKRYLESQGIATQNIAAQGFGEEGLLYADKPYSTLNRRVEIEIKRK